LARVEPLIAVLHVERSQMQSELEDYRVTLNWDRDTNDAARRYSDRQAPLNRIQSKLEN
jgi:hypothetical protein